MSRVRDINPRPLGQSAQPREDDIIAPTRTTLAESRASVDSFLPKYRPIDYKPVGGVTDTLGDDYFDLIEERATKKLNERYFDSPDSLLKQQTNQMNKRGLIGSGIEANASNQLFKTFGDDLVDIQGDITTKKLETGKELAFKNKDIEIQNAANSLASDQKNRDFEGFLSELGLRSAADEAKIATDFDTRMFEQKVKLRDTESDFTSDMLDRLNTALQNEKIDPETRQIFEDIFGSHITANLGRPGTSYESLKTETVKGQPLPPPNSVSPGTTRVGPDGKTYTLRGPDRFGRYNWVG